MENAEPRLGITGRGLFPTDPNRPSKVFCPNHLLLPVRDISLNGDRIEVARNSNLPSEIKNFMNQYYNYFAWGDGARISANSFTEDLTQASDSTKALISNLNLLPQYYFSMSSGEEDSLIRFISTRAVRYKKEPVLAPVWDLLNHSTFSLPFLTSKNGIETPPRKPSGEEIVIKYAPMMSPLKCWAQWGFACRCIVAYGIPLKIRMSPSQSIICCVAEQGSSSQTIKSAYIKNNVIYIKSLPVGSMSMALPVSTLKSILCPLGFTQESVSRLMRQIQRINISERLKLATYLHDSTTCSMPELLKAITLEIELINNSLAEPMLAAQHF